MRERGRRRAARLGRRLRGYQGRLLFDLMGSSALPFAVAALAGAPNLVLLLGLSARVRSAPGVPARAAR